jgi:radical SAM superfamily enzyme YgiQ (UPF0313 family)
MALDSRKILLVHPLGYRAEAAGSDVSRLANLMPPIGLVGIAAYLAQRGFTSSVVDCFARPADAEQVIRERLRADRPAWIGFSCTTSSFLDGARLARLAHEELPGIRTVFGGPHVSALKDQVLERFPEVDFVVAGEGEETLAELMAAGPDGAGAVRGVVLREAGGGTRFTGYRDRGVELDTLPFPAYELLEGYPERYLLPIFSYPKAPNTSAISSRGCPFACSYCDRSVFRRTFRYNSAAYLYEHVKYLRERFGIRHINFYDDHFTFNRKRVEAFCGLMADRPPGVTFNCAARAEHVDPELLRVLKGAGCWMISLGIETGDPLLLAQHRQHPDLDLLARRVREIRAAGIRAKGLVMMGLPGESEASIARSKQYVMSLPLNEFNLAKFTPFPGSPLYDRVRELGTFDEDWERMDCMHFLFVPKGMDREQLERLYADFYRTHYTRLRILWGYFAMLWQSPDSWRRFVANLGGFLRFIRTSRRVGDDEPAGG